MTHDITTQAGSGDVTPAAAHRPSRVAGGAQRVEPSAEGAANVIEAAKRDDSPVAPASGAIDAMNDRRPA